MKPNAPDPLTERDLAEPGTLFAAAQASLLAPHDVDMSGIERVFG